MLQPVDVGRQNIRAYAKIIGDEAIEELRKSAEPLRGLKVVHINATPYGGGVSELLRSLVPLEVDLGIEAEWRIISGKEEFFNVTKLIHDGLQGENTWNLTPAEKETYTSYNCINARELDPSGYDIVVIHDPQPAGIPACLGDRKRGRWVWRCHLDTSEPNAGLWRYFRELIKDYDQAVFTLKQFIPPDFPDIGVSTIPPAIDPLSPKNMPLSQEMASNILAWLGMFPGEPFITQVSRFDKWKDPFGVIKAYQMVRKEIPEIHLALVGSMALDDPTAWALYRELTALDRNDPNLHVFTNLTGVSNVEVNAFQLLSRAVVQKSIREGFGLVVSEALWKETPVVAGRAGGIPLQLKGGGGWLVDSVEECAERLLDVLARPEIARPAAAHGKQYVTDNFLITRLLRDELSLFSRLVSGR